MEWNASLAGPKPTTADIVEDANRLPKRNIGRLKGWFSLDLSRASYPFDVLLCQRQALTWSRKDHRTYANFLIAACAVWAVLGVCVAVNADLTLGQYLVALFLPCAPAFLDAVEVSTDHRRSAEQGLKVEQLVEQQLITAAANPEWLDIDLCRENQDAIYVRRRQAPRVPSWFYRLRRTRMAATTEESSTLFVS